MDISSALAIASLASVIIGLIVVFVQVGSFKGTMEEKISHNGEAIARAFKEIERVETDQRTTTNNVIMIMAGIDYLKESMAEVKSSVKRIENEKCKD